MDKKSLSVSDALKGIVNLYRLIGKPKISTDNRFEAIITSDNEIACAINFCIELPAKFGRFEELLVNGDELRDGQKIIVGQKLSISWALPTSGTPPIYKSFEELLSLRKTIFKGESIECFYVADEDLLVDSSSDDSKANILNQICELISLLSKVAHYHDEKSRADTFRLVYVTNINSENGFHPVLLETKFDKNDLEIEPIDLTALKEIIHASEFSQSHSEEKLSMFRLCLAEMIELTPSNCNTFSFLLGNWSELIQSYKKSFDVYLSGFSFSKVRNELAKSEVEIANSLSKVLGDVTGKLFSIPISFAALLTMSKLKTIEENLMFVIGTILVSLIISGLTRTQLLLKKNIDAGGKLIFSQFEQNGADYPNDLKTCLSDARTTISKQSRLLGTALHGARVVGWLISIIAVAIFVQKFWSN